MKRASARLCVCAFLLACTDPRSRPVAPIVQFTPTGAKIKSPGNLAGSLYTFDSDGLFFAALSVRSSDSALVGDSTIDLGGNATVTRPINWTIPGGMAIGTSLRLIARVQDLTGLATSDTVLLAIQDTI